MAHVARWVGLLGLLAACGGTNAKTDMDALSSQAGTGAGVSGESGAGSAGSLGQSGAGDATSGAASSQAAEQAGTSGAQAAAGTGGAAGSDGTSSTAGTGGASGMRGSNGASGTGGASGDAGTGGGTLPCGGSTPHGCYVAQPGNHPMCPPNTPEQSAYYPPMNEWNGCNGIMPAQPFGQDPTASCSYKGPMGQVATCLCDTGLHWLCTYP
ncbi:MAG TPA: hypothetical protein VHM19_06690 [Polyangiales bacterium]|nr:hypothetical protein [Polyangiales bacterium]